MPDIFGRMPEDYAHIRALLEADLWERHQEGLLAERGGTVQPHNFDALGNGLRGELERAEPNAQAIGYATDNLLAIQAYVDEVLYTRHRLPMLVPMRTDIPEGANEYSVRVVDYVGEGDYISNDGSDAPNAAANERLVPHGVDYAGIDANWTVEDVRNAAFTGFPLTTRYLEAAVRGAQNHMEKVGLVGHEGRGYLGLSRLATTGTKAVTLVTRPASQTFDDITGEAMRDLINDQITAIIDGTEEVFGSTIVDGLCVYLPTKQFGRMSSRFIGDGEDVTVMQAIKNDNPWKHHVEQYGEGSGSEIMFKSMIELKGAGGQIGGSASDRMVITVRDDRVFEMGVPYFPRVLRIMDKGRSVCALVEYKFGSLFVKRPSVIRYIDGI